VKRARFVLFVVLLAGGPALAASEKASVGKRAERLLSSWQLRQAAELLAPFEKQSGRDPEVTFAIGRLAFYRGDYTRAGELMDEALENEPHRPTWQAIRALVKSTRDATAGYHEARSGDGRVVVRYEPGKDAVLVPFVLEAITAAIREIGGDLGYVPEEPVLVEIYPSSDVLAKVSPLTEKDIETSGTIALCKYHRLMLTSPRALLRGYPWLDSLAHEFVHFTVTKISHNRVPIWLHEGLAKWEERRWRGQEPRRLQPTSEHLLAQGLKRKRLITFEQMHPSMAKLPSQEDAGLAFAEVFMAIEYVYQKVGMRGIRQVLRLMRDGKSDADAIAAVMGTSFDAFKRGWMGYLRKLKLRLHPGIVAERIQFKKKGKKKRDELKDIALEHARELTHLGELLRERGQLRAAVVEYRKAVKLAKNRFPVIQNKLAKALLGLRRAQEAAQSLEPTLALYPAYATTYTNLGEAYLALGDTDRGIAAFEEANRLNPFNPRVHEALYLLYGRKGDEKHAERSARSLRVLRGESGDDPWAPKATLGR
jgi:tetratricopeptide (TPR) repeat protein